MCVCVPRPCREAVVRAGRWTRGLANLAHAMNLELAFDGFSANDSTTVRPWTDPGSPPLPSVNPPFPPHLPPAQGLAAIPALTSCWDGASVPQAWQRAGGASRG